MRISDWSSDVCSSDLAYPDLNNWPTILAGVTFTNLFWHTEQLTPNAWSLTFEVIFYSLTCLAVTLLVKKRNWLLGGLTLLLSAAFLVYYPVAIYFLAGLGIRVLYDRGIVARREDRKRAGTGKGGLVRVDLGGGRLYKKKK